MHPQTHSYRPMKHQIPGIADISLLYYISLIYGIGEADPYSFAFYWEISALRYIPQLFTYVTYDSVHM